MKTYFLDTKITGLNSNHSSIVEIAIIAEDGNPLINTLINPLSAIPGSAKAIHGITNGMVGNAPTLDDLWPEIYQLIDGQEVVIYSAEGAQHLFPNNLENAHMVSSAMDLFAERFGDWNYCQSLDKAVTHIGYKREGNGNRALADALACRAVWNWLKEEKRGKLRRVG